MLGWGTVKVNRVPAAGMGLRLHFWTQRTSLPPSQGLAPLTAHWWTHCQLALLIRAVTEKELAQPFPKREAGGRWGQASETKALLWLPLKKATPAGGREGCSEQAPKLGQGQDWLPRRCLQIPSELEPDPSPEQGPGNPHPSCPSP